MNSKIWYLPAAIFIVFSLLSDFSQASETDGRPRVSAGRLGTDFQLDGMITESFWLGVPTLEKFTMVEPNEGGISSERTIVKIAANSKQIVFGIECQVSDPSTIVSFSKRRDADLAREDHIRIVLDPFQDGQSGYIFDVNPGGARYDALISNRGEGENSNWDGIWEVATHKGSSNWSLELSIPIETLSFKTGLHSWYFNIERRIQRKQETDRWASPSPDYQITQISRAGLLSDLPEFDLGLGLSVRPSLIGGAGSPSPHVPTEYTKNASLDLTKKLSSNLISSLTINTDFAETEVDQRQINLTRFPLFFPEKRTFFLEGADIFEFGLGLDEDIVPFFSRRIGLVEGSQVPIVVGSKINGRIRRTNLGALAVHTGDEKDVGTATDLAVVRLKQNVLEESYVGLIATSGDPTGIEGSWLAGADFTFQTSRFQADKNFLVGVWGITMDRSDLRGDKSSYGLKIDYPNDLWDIAFKFKKIGDSFQPSLGFVPRPGIYKYDFGAVYAPRPARLGIRQMFNEFFVTYITDLAGEWKSYEVFTAPVNWGLESGDRIEFNVVRQGERLDQAFDISNGVTILPGAYQWHRYRAELETASKRKISGVVSWSFGDFFDGSLNQILLELLWNPAPLLTFEFSGERNIGHLSAGDFTESLIAGRVRLNFSTDLHVSSLLQYDSTSHSFGTNTRIRWTLTSLAELFVIYNHNVVNIEDVGWQRQSNEFLIKFQYTFRK